MIPESLRIQVFRPTVGSYYTIDDLAVMWRRSRGTIMNWLARLRKHEQRKPTREQVKRIGPNCARRHVEIRDDYAAMIRRLFVDRSESL